MVNQANKESPNVILDFLKDYWFYYVLGIIFLIINTYVRSLSPKLLGIIVDLLSATSMDKQAIFFYLLLMILAAIGAFITRYIWRYYIIGNSRYLECYLRKRLFQHFQTLPVQFYHERKVGNLMAYAINDINAVRRAFGPGLSNLVNGIGMTAVVIYSMTQSINLKLTLITLLPIPIIIYLLLSIGRLVQERFRIVQENFANISDRIQENISGIRVIKAYVQEEQEVENFIELNEEMRNSNIEMVKVSSLLSPLIRICFGVSFMFSLIYGSNMVRNGTITLGKFVAFNGYLTMIVRPITFIGRVINITEKGMASYKRLDEVFQEKPDIHSSYEDKSLTRVSGDIEFKGLNFSYPFSKNLALKNINLKIPEGTTLGIIGETASGKTTLVNLLLRLYKVDRGKITIGKRDINDYPVEVLRESIGYVPQDNILFTTTIRESIHFSRDIYTDEEIEEATKLSHIYENIVEFPRGFDTIVGERGVNLSGGQKQRISIARALIKDPKILILDDSLSAVDTKTEEGIINNLKEVLKDKTGIIIGHRISVVQDADHIIVMEEGEIVEEGSHDELLAKEGVYYDIYKSQFEEVTGELVTNEG